jgi:hypothetical protein
MMIPNILRDLPFSSWNQLLKSADDEFMRIKKIKKN